MTAEAQGQWEEPGPIQGLDAVAFTAQLERIVTLIRRLSPQPDISLTTASTLRTLEREGPTRLSDLATAQGVTQPAMTQLVTRLERDGYARRERDPADARAVLVYLTPEGAQMLGRRRTRRAETMAGLVTQLTPDEIDTIIAALPALDRLTNLSPTTPPTGEHL